tara:strand:- start:30158 stop:31435 length:1278 start_codon:yes stop_codon:yes gene_type:complete
MLNAEKELQKWAPVLEHADAPAITDSYKKAVTAKLLENTEIALREEAQASSFGVLSEDASTNTGSVVNPNPVLISLVRRAMPNLIAYDVAGVQPMSGPTGLIFAMKARFETAGAGNITAGDAEAFKTEPNTDFSGTADAGGAQAASGLFDSPEAGIFTGTGTLTTTAEKSTSLPEMGFTIEKSLVSAKTRQLKAEYSMELAQDLKAVHGLDAESELANILSGEILGEINREVIRSIVTTGKKGGVGATEAFDLVADADGRWAVEKFQSLIFQIEQEANAISLNARRGKGNFVICSANVASALASAGSIAFGGAELNVDAAGNTFAGTLNGGLKVYVDPYATTDYATVGYKGASPYDAGIFYAPYVPLTMVRAVGEASFQPKIAFKTRYGLVANPIGGVVDGIGAQNTNDYFRTFRVKNINVGGQS